MWRREASNREQMGRGNISIPSRASSAFLSERNGKRKGIGERLKWKREKTVLFAAECLFSIVFISLSLLPF